jgi:hypothetical protein
MRAAKGERGDMLILYKLAIISIDPCSHADALSGVFSDVERAGPKTVPETA